MESMRGIVLPVTPPFDPQGQIDGETFRADLRYLIETARVHGLAVCGSTGEGHTFWNAIEGSNLPANVKYAMQVQGRPTGHPRAPMPPASPEQRERTRRALADIK